MDLRVKARLTRLFHGRDRPSMTAVAEELARFCKSRRITPPSRATIYNRLAAVRERASTETT